MFPICFLSFPSQFFLEKILKLVLKREGQKGGFPMTPTDKLRPFFRSSSLIQDLQNN